MIKLHGLAFGAVLLGLAGYGVGEALPRKSTAISIGRARLGRSVISNGGRAANLRRRDTNPTRNSPSAEGGVKQVVARELFPPFNGAISRFSYAGGFAIS